MHSKKPLPRQKKQVKKTPFKTKNVIPNWPVLAANGWPHAPANSHPMRDELAAINHGFKPATFAPVNNIAAAIAASDSIKYLGKHGEILSLNRRVGIHSRSIKIEVQDLLKSEDCHVCGTA